MLTQEMLDRLRRFSGGSYPVLSVYLNVDPDLGGSRSVGARLRDVLKPIRSTIERLDHDAASSLRRDVEAVMDMQGRLEKDVGHGVAVFACSAKDFFEHVNVPRKVWDLAVADARPYIRPLAAVLDEFHRYAAVIVDRRRARIFESYMGEIEQWHETVEQGRRKSNFGGWYGLEEYGARHHAEEAAHRHYRETARLLADLFRERGFDVLFLGGHKGSVEEFTPFLPSELAGRVGGTFTIDPHTATAGIVKAHCRTLEEGHERRLERQAVAQVFDGERPASIGLPATIEAANSHALDLLLVDDGGRAQGVRCPVCGWLGLGPKACGRCGAPTDPCADVVEELTRTAFDDGARTNHVFADTPLRGHLVAALLRFRPLR